ncbi:transcriptional regulator [Paenibacillus cisolokensis]|uniref:GbsR/MarR family transcriptional regulator n=1 Tax=Paenibacillus cisolokensis TaxID=1658519 RepID=UPI003D26D89B
MMEKDKPLEEQYEQAKHEVIEAIAQTMDLYGVNHTFGTLYGVMYFEEKEMTLEEMQQKMNMSKSNMSYAIRSLLSSQMVTKLDKKQVRKDQYIAETDFFKVFQNFFGNKLQREIDVMSLAIDEAIGAWSSIILSPEASEELRSLCLQDMFKLQEAKAYYEWLQRFVNHLQDGTLFQLLPTDASESSGQPK